MNSHPAQATITCRSFNAGFYVTSQSPSKTKAALLDAAAFADALKSAVDAERAGQRHGAVGKLLRERMPVLRADGLGHSDRGDKVAARIARSMDAIIKALYKLSPAGDDIALCAIGGYGRRELAPFSDIDLLFLHRPTQKPADDVALRAVTDFMLYALWDSGLKIGHGVHTPKTAIDFAKQDMIARTAYLDARLLCGSKKLFNDFQGGYDRLRWGTKSQFVAAKLKEQDERHVAAGETRYLVEPDIKEGKGALRDVQTIRWLYKYVYGGAIGEHKAIDKIMDASERRALQKAERFLWSVRVQLHDLRGRADERLTFDVQPEIAARLNYADRKNISAAERLMKHYFLNTVEVGRLTRILFAKLEEERAKRRPRLPTLLPKELQTDEAPGKPNLRIRGGRLDFASAARARKTPRDFFRLFRAFSKKPKIDFHPDALAVIAEQTPTVTSDVRKDASIAALFEGILTKSSDTVRVLRVMTETGLLGKYIPAYGSIVGRIDYGLYRRFTLDEHVLRSIAVLARIRRGQLKDDHPIATKIIKNAETPLLYFLAMLLRESIWTLSDKSALQCEKLVQRIARRLGLSAKDAALVGWGAANHLLMVRTAERRDLTEARAIENFAKSVGSRARLDLMLVLSVCHLRIVGWQSWDQVIRRQLTELYEASAAWFDGGDAALRDRLEASAAAARSQTKAQLAGWSEAEKEGFLSRLTDTMFRSIDPDIIVRFAHLAQAAQTDSADAAVTVTPRDGDIEAIIYADDRPGLLADIAGAVAASGLSVRIVQALTTTDGKALDIFALQSPDGAPLEDLNLTRRLHSALLSAARKAPAKPPSLRRRLGDRRSIFSVAPAVRIEIDASQDATVVETEGLDRPGLLFELAAALAEMDVSIVSAHIATYGERAVDAFYLCDRKRRKITDAAALKKIEKKLLSVLSSGSGQ